MNFLVAAMSLPGIWMLQHSPTLSWMHHVDQRHRYTGPSASSWDGQTLCHQKNAFQFQQTTHFVGKSICFILHTSAYFCCVVTKSKKNGHRHAVDCEFPSNVQALGFVQKLGFHLKVFEEPDTLCCDQCSHTFLSSSAKCRDEMHQRPSSNGHSQNENTNRKSLRLSIFLGWCIGWLFFEQPMWLRCRANHQDPKVLEREKSDSVGSTFFHPFFLFFSGFYVIIVVSFMI